MGAIKLEIAPTRMIFWYAALVTILGSYLAILSRFRILDCINESFTKIGGGHQSNVEHFLGSASISSLFIATAIAMYRLTEKGKFQKSIIREMNFIRFRIFIIKKIKIKNLLPITIIIISPYFALSLSWELKQIPIHGYFQVDQFFSDIAGAIFFIASCVLLTTTTPKGSRTAIDNE